jgi:hypothetical protein
VNIFYLDPNTTKCAEYHVDRHCVKMIVEYAQLLSTAHRVLDGVEYVDTSSGRKIKRWKLDSSYEPILYKATHINHPSAVWVRQSYKNYMWLRSLLYRLCKEYTYRYGKVHKVQSCGLYEALSYAPINIKTSIFTEPTPAMPDIYKVVGDSVQSYINYYLGDKQRMFKWKNRDVPYFVKGE